MAGALGAIVEFWSASTVGGVVDSWLREGGDLCRDGGIKGLQDFSSKWGSQWVPLN